MKPILFNTDMVRAILDGRKTQTRRVVKYPSGYVTGRPGWGPQGFDDAVGGYWFDVVRYQTKSKALKTATADVVRSPYNPGDILYVRETYDELPVKPDCSWSGGKTYLYYRADGDLRPEVWRGNWKPSIYMPKAAARLFLRVTDVRAERLQESFNAPTTPILAVQAEGIDIGDTCRECINNYGWPCCVEALDDDGSTLGECGMLDENRGEFSDLWDSTIKPADLDRCGWDANPWVWVICFERCEKPEVQT